MLTTPRHDRERAVPGSFRRTGCIGSEQHVHHSARAESALGHVRTNARLAHQRRLLVSGQCGYRGRTFEFGGVSDHARRRHDGRQDLHRNSECLARPSVPTRSTVGGDLAESGDRGIAVIGDVQRTSRQCPGDPGVDGAEGEIVDDRRHRRRVADVIFQKPRHLRRRLVRSQTETVFEFGHDAFTDGSQVLPTESRSDGHAGAPAPHDGGRTLIGDADRRHGTGVGDGESSDLQNQPRHLEGIELHEAGERRRRNEGSMVKSVHRTVGAHDGGP